MSDSPNSSDNLSRRDNLELLSIKCPHCDEVSPAPHWVTMAIATTPHTASLSFMGKPKNSNGLVCPKCRLECHYDEIIEAMTRRLTSE